MISATKAPIAPKNNTMNSGAPNWRISASAPNQSEKNTTTKIQSAKRPPERITIASGPTVISRGGCHAAALCTRGPSSSRPPSVRNTGKSNDAL